VSNIIPFPRRPASRSAAKRWMKDRIINGPDLVLKVDENYIGPDLFHGWRVVLGLDGMLYFANCIDQGIPLNELLEEIADEAVSATACCIT